MNITVTEIQDWLSDFGQLIEENKDYLSELDLSLIHI